ncbi:hypothetical protein ACWEPL_43995 [Nonomuraea sp. NPDC004186]
MNITFNRISRKSGAIVWQFPSLVTDMTKLGIGSWEIFLAWWAQFVPDGRTVVSLRLRGSGLTRSVAAILQPAGLREPAAHMAASIHQRPRPIPTASRSRRGIALYGCLMEKNDAPAAGDRRQTNSLSAVTVSLPPPS